MIHRHQEKVDLPPALQRRPVLEPLDHPRPIHYQVGTDHEDHRHIDEEHESASHQRQELTDDALYILDQLLLRGLHDRWRDADAVQGRGQLRIFACLIVLEECLDVMGQCCELVKNGERHIKEHETNQGKDDHIGQQDGQPAGHVAVQELGERVEQVGQRRAQEE